MIWNQSVENDLRTKHPIYSSGLDKNKYLEEHHLKTPLQILNLMYLYLYYEDNLPLVDAHLSWG
ncbi:hypothetical protein ASD64_19415 [Mesorhizobium sp. Root157]|nr:hypothetical protein ASD64_19415 [Mesorhizobium sp. Root157]